MAHHLLVALAVTLTAPLAATGDTIHLRTPPGGVGLCWDYAKASNFASILVNNCSGASTQEFV
jgi:hypothetical protein